MITRRLLHFSSAALAIAALASCAEENPTKPPDILYGQSVCTDCGMIISDARFAAATIVRDELGRAEHWLYDDIGDMLRHERDLDGSRVIARWAHDYMTSEWIRAESATFLRSEQLHTPMASGIAAFATPEAAAAAQSDLPGETFDLAQLQRDAAQ